MHIPWRRSAVFLSSAALAASVAIVGVPSANADTFPANPTDPLTPVTVSADRLPTAQINGVVWSQVIIGNTVYVGGNFSSARPAGSPAGTNEVARANIMAYNLTTGELIGSFAPRFNAQVSHSQPRRTVPGYTWVEPSRNTTGAQQSRVW